MIRDDHVGEKQPGHKKRTSRKMMKCMPRPLLDELEDKEQKFLGEVWNHMQDTITYRFDALIEPSTKKLPTMSSLAMFKNCSVNVN